MRRFGFNGEVDFFEPEPFIDNTSSDLVRERDRSNSYAIGYRSDPFQTSEGIYEGIGFTFAALFNLDNILTGLAFRVTNFGGTPAPDLAQVLDALGPPDYWTLYWQREGFITNPAKESDFMSWVLMYKPGFLVGLRIPGPVKELEDRNYAIMICEQAAAVDTSVFLNDAL